MIYTTNPNNPNKNHVDRNNPNCHRKCLDLVEDREDLPFHWDLDLLRRAAARDDASGPAQSVAAALAPAAVAWPPANNRPVDLAADEYVNHVMSDFMMCKPRQGVDEPFSLCQVKSGEKPREVDAAPYVWVMWWERRHMDDDVFKDSWVEKRRAPAEDVR